jgi:hypothetical protein
VVGVRVVRAAESAVLLAVGGREQQTLATWKSHVSVKQT